MTRRLLALAFLALPAGAHAQAFDPARSRVEFDVHTRVGALVRGTFPRFAARVDTLPDGRRQVHATLDAASLRIGGSERMTRLARGPQLFDAERYPTVEFVSDPYPADLVRAGGALPGRLRLHGVERRERFELAGATCDRPGRDCEILATGRVSRDDYGLDGWRWALADRVRFRLHVRFSD